MGVPTSEVGYTIAKTRRENHVSLYEHVAALEKKKLLCKELSQNVLVEAIKVEQVRFYRVLLSCLLLPPIKEATICAGADGTTQQP